MMDLTLLDVASLFQTPFFIVAACRLPVPCFFRQHISCTITPPPFYPVHYSSTEPRGMPFSLSQINGSGGLLSSPSTLVECCKYAEHKHKHKTARATRWSPHCSTIAIRGAQAVCVYKYEVGNRKESWVCSEYCLLNRN